MKAYPEPVEIPALRDHTHTFILLHGRGSNAERFGRELLSSTSLAARLPSTKFVFPTARKRRSTALNRIAIHEWFDIYSLDDPEERSELQIDGLAQTGHFLRTLVEREARILGHGEGAYERVLLGGLSQGCAAGAFALLGGLAGESRLGGFVGLNGWLPFQGQLDEIAGVEEKPPAPARAGGTGIGGDGASDSPDAESERGSDESDEPDRNDEPDGNDATDRAEESDSDGSSQLEYDTLPGPRQEEEEQLFDPFAREGDDNDGSSTQEHRAPELPRPLQALNHVRDILDLAPLTTGATSQPARASASHLQTPIFVGHGAADSKVSPRLGERMAHTFSAAFGMDVTWRSYAGLGHWYRVPDEIDDVLEFLHLKAGVVVEGPLGAEHRLR